MTSDMVFKIRFREDWWYLYLRREDGLVWLYRRGRGEFGSHKGVPVFLIGETLGL